MSDQADHGPSRVASISRPDLEMNLILRYGWSGAGFSTWQLDFETKDGVTTDSVFQRPLDVAPEDLRNWLEKSIDSDSAVQLTDAFHAANPDLFAATD